MSDNQTSNNYWIIKIIIILQKKYLNLLKLNKFSIPSDPISSHYLIEFTTNIKCEQYSHNIESVSSSFDKVNFRNEKMRWDEIRSFLAVQPWDVLMANSSPTEMFHTLIEKCEYISLRHAPRKRVNVYRKKTLIPRHRRTLMRNRTNVRNRIK